MTGAIDRTVKSLERLVPLTRSLQPPPDLAAPFEQYAQGAELLLGGLKRLNWGLVEDNNQILGAALADYTRAFREMGAAHEASETRAYDGYPAHDMPSAS
jgi:hypothetical protein